MAVTAGDFDLYLSMAIDQFGHGFEGAVFVVYLFFQKYIVRAVAGAAIS